MLICDHAIGQAVTSPFPRNALSGPDPIERDERGGGEDLGKRAGLKGFRERARPHGAIGAPRRHREDLARCGIEHDDIAAVRFHIIDRVIERTLRNLL